LLRPRCKKKDKEAIEKYWELIKTITQKEKIIEDYAENYANIIYEKAEGLKLLERPDPKEVRFASIMRSKYIESHLKMIPSLIRNSNQDFFGGRWRSVYAVLDHLRKCGLGPQVKYNLREVYMKIFDDIPTKKKLQKFKRLSLKVINPLYYISKTGRKYTYFSDEEFEVLRNFWVLDEIQRKKVLRYYF
jgi:hypothetical protein